LSQAAHDRRQALIDYHEQRRCAYELLGRRERAGDEIRRTGRRSGELFEDVLVCSDSA